MNRRNPAIKRILADVKELNQHPSSRYHAAPLEDNMFEWHFTIRGPPDTAFEGGIYHGRILLPAEYPMKPPNIVFLTKNGRFEVGTKICLSISAYHEESWQPAWGVRTMLEAIISFLPSEGAGAIGALDWTPQERKRLAKESHEFKCSTCGLVKDLLTVPEPAKTSSATSTAAETTETADAVVAASAGSNPISNTNSSNSNSNSSSNTVDSGNGKMGIDVKHAVTPDVVPDAKAASSTAATTTATTTAVAGGAVDSLLCSSPDAEESLHRSISTSSAPDAEIVSQVSQLHLRSVRYNNSPGLPGSRPGGYLNDFPTDDCGTLLMTGDLNGDGFIDVAAGEGMGMANSLDCAGVGGAGGGGIGDQAGGGGFDSSNIIAEKVFAPDMDGAQDLMVESDLLPDMSDGIVDELEMPTIDAEDNIDNMGMIELGTDDHTNKAATRSATTTSAVLASSSSSAATAAATSAATASGTAAATPATPASATPAAAVPVRMSPAAAAALKRFQSSQTNTEAHTAETEKAKTTTSTTTTAVAADNNHHPATPATETAMLKNTSSTATTPSSTGASTAAAASSSTTPGVSTMENNRETSSQSPMAASDSSSASSSPDIDSAVNPATTAVTTTVTTAISGSSSSDTRSTRSDRFLRTPPEEQQRQLRRRLRRMQRRQEELVEAIAHEELHRGNRGNRGNRIPHDMAQEELQRLQQLGQHHHNVIDDRDVVDEILSYILISIGSVIAFLICRIMLRILYQW